MINCKDYISAEWLYVKSPYAGILEGALPKEQLRKRSIYYFLKYSPLQYYKDDEIIIVPENITPEFRVMRAVALVYQKGGDQLAVIFFDDANDNILESLNRVIDIVDFEKNKKEINW